MPRISKTQLIKLQKRYHTDAAVGRLFGISRQAVHKLRRGLQVAPVADKHGRRDFEIARLYRQGRSGAWLARRWRLSVAQVYRILRAQAVALRRPRTPGGIATA